jgi:TRAP-type C4-dicarboxylate transport system substrate-binding protein
MVREKEYTMGRSSRTTAALAVLALVITACAGNPDGTKAGGTGTPIVLTIGTDDFPGRPAADQIEEFARRMQSLSQGFITLEPVWRAGDGFDDWDQEVIRKVVKGELAMASIPARAFDTEGVTALKALHAPFLITNDDLLDRVVASDIAGEMLAELDTVGVVGLALLPSGLRHPFGPADRPLLRAADYEGARIRSPKSDTSRLIFEALGAVPNFDPEWSFESQTAVESGYGYSTSGSSVGNVTFFPKVNVLVINASSFEGLTENQRQIIRTAANETLTWVIENRPSDIEAAAEFCETGGTVVLADPAEVSALEAATQPVYSKLESDELTRGFIQRIREMKSSLQVAATLSAACSGADPDQPDELDAARIAELSVLNGVYRSTTWTVPRLVEMGFPADDARNLAGTFFMTFETGRFELAHDWAFGGRVTCPGRYDVNGDTVTIHFHRAEHCGPGGLHSTATFRLSGNELLFTNVITPVPGDDVLTAADPWTRVGDVD